MFVGHYGVSFAAKSADRDIPLWLLFVAAQAVDILWAILVLVGVESIRIVPGFTASVPIDFEFIGYSHSLLAVFVWACVAFVAMKSFEAPLGSNRAALLVALAVLSHWPLDLIVHRPDLPLYDVEYRMGMGLWDYPVASFLVETGLLLAGLACYLRSTRPVVRGGRYGMPVLVAAMLLIQLSLTLGPAIRSPALVALGALALYVGFAVVAYSLEQQRV